MASIINNIFIIQESDVVVIKKDINNAYRGNILEAVFQDDSHLNNNLVVEEKIKVFVKKLLDQAGAFY